jgi:hypothetical protein
MEKWDAGKDQGFLFSQFYKIQKYEQESVREFNAKFDALMEEFPLNSRPMGEITSAHYLNAFEGKFQFLLKDKFPQTLKEAQDLASQIENNLNSCAAS